MSKSHKLLKNVIQTLTKQLQHDIFDGQIVLNSLFFTAVASRNSAHNCPKFPILLLFSCEILSSSFAVSSEMSLGRQHVYR